MVDFIMASRGIVISISIIMSFATLGAYLFGEYSQSAYDRWSYWVMKLIGFLTALVVIPITPYILYKVGAEWNNPDNESGIFVMLLAWTVMAAGASLVHLIGFPRSTYRMFRSQKI